jgi:hypothetical protein
MNDEQKKFQVTTTHRWFIRLLVGVLFAVNFGLQPLYTDNQNTKFLHGAAASGYGYLSDDWTAKTLDPLPVFSVIVQWLYGIKAIWLSYICCILLLFVYVYALYGIFNHTYRITPRSATLYLFTALFFIAHKFGMESGLARQYILDHYFQPSLFGVFLLLSIYHFLEKRTFWSAVWLAVATAFHPGGYLPAALLLLIVYTALAIWQRRSVRDAAIYWIVFAILMAPLLIRYMILFSPTSHDIWQRSIVILSDIRIPHHTKVQEWFNHRAVVRIILIMLSIFLIRKSPLFWIMAVPFTAILLVTGLLYIFPDSTLTFTTPWRASVMLMPIASTILLGWIATKLIPVLERYDKTTQRIKFIAIVLILCSTAVGAVRQYHWFKYYDHADEMPVIRFAKDNARPGDSYLAPPHMTEFDKFRLETGIPILVNWKTHPYKDTQVIEWYDRIQLASEFYAAAGKPECCGMLEDITRNYKITHVIIDAKADIAANCPGLTEIYHDAFYSVYRIQ